MPSRKENRFDPIGMPNARANQRSSRRGSRAAVQSDVISPGRSGSGGFSNSCTVVSMNADVNPRVVLAPVEPGMRDLGVSSGKPVHQPSHAHTEADANGAAVNAVPTEERPQNPPSHAPETHVTETEHAPANQPPDQPASTAAPQGDNRPQRSHTKKDRKKSAKPQPPSQPPRETLDAGAHNAGDSASGTAVIPKSRTVAQAVSSETTEVRRSERMQDKANKVEDETPAGLWERSFKFVMYEGKLLKADCAEEMELPFCVYCPLAFPSGLVPARDRHQRLPHYGYPKFTCVCRCVFATEEERDAHIRVCDVEHGRVPEYILVEYRLPRVRPLTTNDCDDNDE